MGNSPINSNYQAYSVPPKQPQYEHPSILLPAGPPAGRISPPLDQQQRSSLGHQERARFLNGNVERQNSAGSSSDKVLTESLDMLGQKEKRRLIEQENKKPSEAHTLALASQRQRLEEGFFPPVSLAPPTNHVLRSPPSVELDDIARQEKRSLIERNVPGAKAHAMAVASQKKRTTLDDVGELDKQRLLKLGRTHDDARKLALSLQQIRANDMGRYESIKSLEDRGERTEEAINLTDGSAVAPTVQPQDFPPLPHNGRWRAAILAEAQKTLSSSQTQTLKAMTEAPSIEDFMLKNYNYEACIRQPEKFEDVENLMRWLRKYASQHAGPTDIHEVRIRDIPDAFDKKVALLEFNQNLAKNMAYKDLHKAAESAILLLEGHRDRQVAEMAHEFSSFGFDADHRTMSEPLPSTSGSQAPPSPPPVRTQASMPIVPQAPVRPDLQTELENLPQGRVLPVPARQEYPSKMGKLKSLLDTYTTQVNSSQQHLSAYGNQDARLAQQHNKYVGLYYKAQATYNHWKESPHWNTLPLRMRMKLFVKENF